VRFYPNAITLRPEVTAAEVLASADPFQPFAVKDSFARLDLASAGFRLLAEASWIVRDPGQDAPQDDSLCWDRVASPGELSDWETAWAGGASDDGRVFQPGLLSDPRCAILACRQEDSIIAGAIVYTADGAAGISNLFGIGLPQDRLWASIGPVVAGLRSQLPIVGWEEGASLEAARKAGFHVTGALRVWVR
jgi:hypothetical protein